ncbi:MAG: shikimate kinase [Muribaculaceae bacterium]|nr:shikimate kinase [Muribaculaceae bacterium]
MKPIFLIGFPGCGKTTLGCAVAAVSPLSFIDLDEAVAARAGKSVPRIFAEDGEEAFRRLEAETLAALCAQPDTLIATGGGTPCVAGLMDAMLANGTVVWLTASRERLLDRLIEGRAKRPHIAHEDAEGIGRYIDSLLPLRTPFYERAHTRFDANRLDTADELAESVAKFLTTFNLK